MSNQHIVAAIISNCKRNFHTSFLYMSASEKNQWDTAKQILITKSDMDLGWCFNFTLGFTLIRHFAICTLQNNETNVLLHSSWTCFLECVLLYLLCFYLAEPKPVYAQPGQPDVDLPVSPSDAPVPSAAHDDSILR